MQHAAWKHVSTLCTSTSQFCPNKRLGLFEGVDTEQLAVGAKSEVGVPLIRDKGPA